MIKSSAKRAFTETTEFPVSYVNKCEEGEHYVYPGVGPVLCKGVEILSLSGIGHVETITFEETHARLPKTMRLTDMKLRANGIRKLVDESTMDAIIVKIDNADGSGFRFKNSNQIRATYETMVSSTDPAVVCELIGKTLGLRDKGSETFKGRASLGIEFGNRALTMLVREYALVKQVDIAQAERIVTEKSGKHGRARWELPDAPDAPQPSA